MTDKLQAVLSKRCDLEGKEAAAAILKSNQASAYRRGYLFPLNI
jgi:hypothetical protein